MLSQGLKLSLGDIVAVGVADDLFQSHIGKADSQVILGEHIGFQYGIKTHWVNFLSDALNHPNKPNVMVGGSKIEVVTGTAIGGETPGMFGGVSTVGYRIGDDKFLAQFFLKEPVHLSEIEPHLRA